MAALWVRANGGLPGSGWLMASGIAAALALAYAAAPFVELPFSERAKLRARAPEAPAPASHTRLASPRPAAAQYEEVADERRAA
jgi:peptidoglycan/LPS O-acetylase OafA/YrhL